MHNDVLYQVSPEYRRAIDQLIQTRSRLGALEAAYQNALGERQRAKSDLRELARAVEELVGRYAVIGRDDPGRGGSGGAPS
jgi:hypothetical protein